ncbi:hypothetical protein V5E97_26390 [Singulisphaera sp. Ch08]|uniref:Uncharacterized protein n=1 Tax=Singulisphaera sp. Ch08 TaxID=3120278 RepID=A0AAU7C9N2_9BACT
MANLIGRVVFEPVAVRPGESVRVEVFGPDDTAIDPAAAVTIDGVPGAVRHLQYATPGARRLFVRARGADGKVESTVADLEVAGALEFATIEGVASWR